MDKYECQEGLGAGTARFENLQFRKNAKENSTVPTKYSYKNSTTSQVMFTRTRIQCVPTVMKNRTLYSGRTS